MEKSRSWSSAHDWKSCIPHKGIKGSNPFFSATKMSRQQAGLFLWRRSACGEIIRFAQILREGHTLPSRALPMQFWKVRFFLLGIRIMSENPGGAFVSQCKHWRTHLFSFRHREKRMQANPFFVVKIHFSLPLAGYFIMEDCAKAAPMIK